MLASQKRLDLLAVGLSLACWLQCLALPVVLILSPGAFAASVDDATFHWVLAWVVLPVSVLALFLGCRRHRTWSVLIPAVLGLVIIFSAAWAGHDLLGPRLEMVAALLGSGLLALAHIINYRLCRSHQFCEH